MTESISPMWGNILPSLRRGTASRRPAPITDSRARREERALPIVPMSSGRLFLDRVGRHQSRLRFTGTGRIPCTSQSTGKRGHFYFARKGTFLLCLDKSAGTVDALPFSGENNGASVRTGDPNGPSQSPATNAELDRVSAGYLETMGLRLLQGRWFRAEDEASGSNTAIVDEGAAAASGRHKILSANGSASIASLASRRIGNKLLAW